MKLFLDVFIFQLKKKVGGKYLNEAVNFDEIHTVLATRYPDKKPMAALLQNIASSIDTTFYLNDDNSKALSFCKGDTFSINENGNFISGRFVGGNTGQQFDVYSNEDATQITHIVQPSEVASLQFYFKLWFPKGFTTGILIVQKYSNNTCLGLLKKRLSSFFKNLGYKFITHKFVPENKRNEFLEACSISQIGITWKRGLDNSLKPQVNLLRDCNFSQRISNLSLSTTKLLTDAIYRRKVTEEVSTLYPQFDPTLHDMKFYYIDSKGQTASSTLDEIECLLPSISLGITCVNPDDTPNWSAIDNAANNYLELIKVDLKYSAKEQQ